MVRNIYVIGKGLEGSSLKSDIDFLNTCAFLEEKGFRVVNTREPADDCILDEDMFRANFRLLLSCDSVYLMPHVPVLGSKNVELLLALRLNLLVVQ